MQMVLRILVIGGSADSIIINIMIMESEYTIFLIIAALLGFSLIQ